jgi:aminoglycoside phosphotransferase family enzyme
LQDLKILKILLVKFDINISTKGIYLKVFWQCINFNELKSWCLNANIEGTGSIKERLENGFVRECQGGLHLGNIALIKNGPNNFNCRFYLHH